MTCKARQYSDEMQCGRCGLCWDVNDPDPPKCLDNPAPVRMHGVVGGTAAGYYRPPKPRSPPVDVSRVLTDDEVREQRLQSRRLERIENRRKVMQRRRIEDHQNSKKPR